MYVLIDLTEGMAYQMEEEDQRVDYFRDSEDHILLHVDVENGDVGWVLYETEKPLASYPVPLETLQGDADD